MKLLTKVKRNTRVYIMAFVLILGMDYNDKLSINQVSAYTIDQQIEGVGKVKSNKIIQEREVNGDYKNIQDFNERTKDFVGEKVQGRLAKAYKI